MTPGVSLKCRAGTHAACTVNTCQCSCHPGGRVKVTTKPPPPLPPVTPSARSEIPVTPAAIRFVESLADSEIRARLSQRDIHPNVVDDLVRQRKTVGARWRLIQELYR